MSICMPRWDSGHIPKNILLLQGSERKGKRKYWKILKWDIGSIKWLGYEVNREWEEIQCFKKGMNVFPKKKEAAQNLL